MAEQDKGIGRAKIDVILAGVAGGGPIRIELKEPSIQESAVDLQRNRKEPQRDSA